MWPGSQPNGAVPCSTDRSAGLQVIVCSLPRTGTTSIKLALEQLGYPNVYHMRTFIDQAEEDGKLWGYVINAKANGHHIPRSIWDGLLGKYQVVVDAPGCYFATELAQAYPDAKVVVLNRDPEKWYASFVKTVQKLIRRRQSFELLEWVLRPCLPSRVSTIIRIGNLLSNSGIGLGSYSKEECMDFFHRYYANCRANIAGQRCIEYNVQDGWTPLCKHLDIHAPGQQTSEAWIPLSFPQVNDVDSFNSWVAQIQYSMLRQAWRNIVLYGLVLLGVIVLLSQVAWLVKLNPCMHGY